MISTTNLAVLPNKLHLRQICKALSVLDAIISPEWEYRYYSYQSKWSDNEEFCEMRNGQGDHMLILFRDEGCVINGMTHEYYPKDKSKLTKGLPEVFKEFIFGEPVNSIGTTFCLWTFGNSKWMIGDLENFEDGSEEMLEIFDGDPQTYINWATDYYEDGFVVNEHTYKVVSDIYQGNVLTKEMVLSLVTKLEDWDKLKEDLKEIDFPFQF
jgi:hypothetical protein